MQRAKPVLVYSTEPFAEGSFNSALSLIETFEYRKTTKVWLSPIFCTERISQFLGGGTFQWSLS